MVLFIQCMVVCLLFSLAILVQLIKNDPVKNLYNYPPNIQKRVKSMKEYEGRIPSRNDKLTFKLMGAVVFVLVGMLLVWTAEVDGFLGAFIHMFLLFTVVNLYDLIVIDWLLFRYVKRFRIPGTEDMVKDYHNYWFHFVAFLKGIVIGLVIAVVVASVYSLLFSLE
ncbi:hypothetical protein [Gracilibacillus timonensis]|uniref:hypothetical protein n=1 Tax=Gracilibacillus timonensis TaxID=1816696 RepID=UPI000AFA4A8B|nr:hypothetical protein [Gracilibacillus timonensis]